jgi:glutamate-1-semialdehyde aminotransferase
MGLGGAQKYFGVTPDITVISKGIANGYPISAVVGKSEIMEAGAKTTISATYFPSTLGIAAALATLKKLEEKNGIAHIWGIAKQLVDGLNHIIETRKVKASVVGVPQMPFLIFGDDSLYKKYYKNQIYDSGDPGSEKDKALMKVFYNETIKRGIFFHPRHHWYSCLSHTEEDVKKTLQVSEEAMDIALKQV